MFTERNDSIVGHARYLYLFSAYALSNKRRSCCNSLVRIFLDAQNPRMIDVTSGSPILREQYWITKRPVPPDWGGPSGIPYRPYPEALHLSGLRPIEELARTLPNKLAI